MSPCFTVTPVVTTLVMQNLANDQLTPKIFFAAKAAKFDQKGSKNFLRHQFSK